jgi:hypothetical protein
MVSVGVAVLGTVIGGNASDFARTIGRNL